MHLRERAIDGESAGREIPLLVSVPEAARLLGVGKTLGWKMVRSGQLPTKKFGTRVLVPRVALERLARAEDSGGQSDDDAGIPSPMAGP